MAKQAMDLVKRFVFAAAPEEDGLSLVVALGPSMPEPTDCSIACQKTTVAGVQRFYSFAVIGPQIYYPDP